LEFGLVVLPMQSSHVVLHCCAKIAVIVELRELILAVTNLAVIIHRPLSVSLQASNLLSPFPSVLFCVRYFS